MASGVMGPESVMPNVSESCIEMSSISLPQYEVPKAMLRAGAIQKIMHFGKMSALSFALPGSASCLCGSKCGQYQATCVVVIM